MQATATTSAPSIPGSSSNATPASRQPEMQHTGPGPVEVAPPRPFEQWAQTEGDWRAFIWVCAFAGIAILALESRASSTPAEGALARTPCGWIPGRKDCLSSPCAKETKCEETENGYTCRTCPQSAEEFSRDHHGIYLAHRRGLLLTCKSTNETSAVIEDHVTSTKSEVTSIRSVSTTDVTMPKDYPLVPLTGDWLAGTPKASGSTKDSRAFTTTAPENPTSALKGPSSDPSSTTFSTISPSTNGPKAVVSTPNLHGETSTGFQDPVTSKRLDVTSEHGASTTDVTTPTDYPLAPSGSTPRTGDWLAGTAKTSGSTKDSRAFTTTAPESPTSELKETRTRIQDPVTSKRLDVTSELGASTTDVTTPTDYVLATSGSTPRTEDPLFVTAKVPESTRNSHAITATAPESPTSALKTTPSAPSSTSPSMIPPRTGVRKMVISTPTLPEGLDRIFVVDKSKENIYVSDLHDISFTKIFSTEIKALDVAFSSTDQKLYWSQEDDKVYRSNVIGEYTETISNNDYTEPLSIVISESSRKLYCAYRSDQVIVEIALDDSTADTVFIDVNEPELRSLAIDETAGFLYFSRKRGIERVSLSNKDRVLWVDEGSSASDEIPGLSIDIYGGRLFFTFENHVKYMDLNTRESSTLLMDLEGDVSDVHFYKGNLYWTFRGKPDLMKVDGTNGPVTQEVILYNLFEDPNSIHINSVHK